eukprot:TRINITY_DN7521_c0_g1_i3.p1 TRINITY_DN7521_c0_g1~~TRINITY_DN7521_c0_g1_i3.p1  ORF type:complete len:175 (+),score=15.79 TRINITY_DN7521_c0_g1_i3:103-627(+)
MQLFSDMYMALLSLLFSLIPSPFFSVFSDDSFAVSRLKAFCLSHNQTLACLSSFTPVPPAGSSLARHVGCPLESHVESEDVAELGNEDQEEQYNRAVEAAIAYEAQEALRLPLMRPILRCLRKAGIRSAKETACLGVRLSLLLQTNLSVRSPAFHQAKAHNIASLSISSQAAVP